MKSPKTKTPPISDPVPVPQPDDPALIDVRRRTREQASEREGTAASLLTPGGASGVTGGDQPKRKRLGYGAATA